MKGFANILKSYKILAYFIHPLPLILHLTFFLSKCIVFMPIRGGDACKGEEPLIVASAQVLFFGLIGVL